MSRRITFRVEEPLYEFLEQTAKFQGKLLSECVRDICEYFHTGLLMGEFHRTRAELEAEVLKKLGTKRQRKKFLKKFKPSRVLSRIT
jgi:hypothetical protein